jgi:hypothetical protein
VAAANIDPTSIHPIELRKLKLANNLVVAPLAGVSDLPFRLISKEAGAALTFTETVSAKGLVMGGHKTRRLLDTSAREAPVAFQLFGSEPEVLGEACRMLEEDGAAWIDLNVGCPVKKFIKNKAGSALLKDLPHAAKIVRFMRRNFSGTLSVKMRTGWDADSIVAPEFARMAVDEGAELISVHGRTRAQQYTGKVNREIIRRVVAEVPDVPVLANGDILTPLDVFEMIRETGAAGVMIGRGAMGNPWIFEQTLSLARGGRAEPPSKAQRLETIERHMGWIERAFDNPKALANNLKKYVSAYSHGLPGSARFRQRTLESEDPSEITDLTRRFFSAAAPVSVLPPSEEKVA